MKDAGDSESCSACVRFLQDVETEGQGFGAVFVGGGGFGGVVAGDEVAEVGDDEHLQDGLVAAREVLAVVLFEEIETPLGMCEDDIFNQKGGKVLKIDERTQKLCDGVIVEDSRERTDQSG